MSESSAGSYAFGEFDENQKELDRLKFQAGTARDLEQHILRRSGLKPGMQVLDLACGPGIISCELARMVEGGTVLGVDLSPALLEEAKQAAASENVTNVRFQQGDVYDLDLAANSFDFVYARFLFQHLEQVEKAMQSVLRVLKPGGVLAIMDVDDDWLTLHPEPDTFRSFTQRAAKAQAARGGDRFIGRKLGAYLADSGYTEVKVAVDTVTTGELGMQAFLDITTGFKHEQLADEDKQMGGKEQDMIYQLLKQPNAWGFGAVFIGTGRKP